eukprot:TRINITY_DN1162_c0_g1_i1.p1 TRINITY_DN1162_c0_g1~~TRINITY_DN1162_c0_g1_i1.p1  ORF type:complete len:152 (+),score=33.25 TRINITY_DN1162_c0_g1_i1:94-549(+)
MVNILVAMDDHEGSTRALEKAVEIMHKDRDHITLVHAIDVGMSGLVQAAAFVDPLTGDLSTAEAIDRSEKKKAAKGVKDKCATFCATHSIKYDYVEEYGAPIEVIQKTVERLHPSVLVMGTRSLNAFQRLIIGSVSTHFVQHAPCAVMVVP